MKEYCTEILFHWLVVIRLQLWVHFQRVNLNKYTSCVSNKNIKLRTNFLELWKCKSQTLRKMPYRIFTTSKSISPDLPTNEAFSSTEILPQMRGNLDEWFKQSFHLKKKESGILPIFQRKEHSYKQIYRNTEIQNQKKFWKMNEVQVSNRIFKINQGHVKWKHISYKGNLNPHLPYREVLVSCKMQSLFLFCL